MATEWYVSLGGKDQGPFSSSKLKQFADAGKIKPETHVRKGEGTWEPAGRIAGLFSKPENDPIHTENEPKEDDISSWLSSSTGVIVEAESKPSPEEATEATAAPKATHAPPTEKRARPTARAPALAQEVSGFIAQTLLPNENVLYRGRIHPGVFAMALPALVSVLLALFTVIVGLTGRDLEVITVFGFVLGTIALIYAFTRLIQATNTYMTTEIAVTDKRVLGKTGLIARESMELLLTKIEGIEVKQSIIERLFNFGNVTITGTGSSRTRFRGVAKPLEFRRKVQGQLDAVQSH